jgi:micrococcal nuclease
MLIAALLLLACHATDGDTIRCGRERIRLQGIDAPEMRGHCRRGRVCVKGDPIASKRSLARALQSGPIRIERIGRDHYGRTLGNVRAGTVNLSCWQISNRQAIYKPKWDDGRRIGSTCAAATP